MADRTSAGGTAGGDAPQLTLLNLFATPLAIAALPDAVRPCSGTRERISIAVNFSLAGV